MSVVSKSFLKSNVVQRTLSALVLIPVVLCVLLLAPLWGKQLFMGGITLVMLYEWWQMSKCSSLVRAGSAASLIILFFVLSVPHVLPSGPHPLKDVVIVWGPGAFLVSLAIVAILARSTFFMLGCVVILFSMCVMTLMLAVSAFFVWVLVIIWVNDTAAYIAGRTFKGPKLWPAVSPGKTWSGFIGGVAVSAVVATLVVPYFLDGNLLEHLPVLPLATWATLLALAANGGDLMESAAKRYYGVKDSSNFIPGHGGFLDRLDSLLGVGLVYGCAVSLVFFF